MNIAEKIAQIFRKPDDQTLPGEPVVEDLVDGRIIAWRRYGIVGVCCLVLVLGFYVSSNYGGTDTSEKKRQRQRVTVADRQFNTRPPVVVETEPVTDEYYDDEPAYTEEPEPEYVAEETVVAAQQTKIVYVPAPKPATPRVPKGRGGSSVMMVGNGAAQPSGGAVQVAGNTTASVASGQSGGVERAYAEKLENTDMMILQGEKIPCTLHGAINTQLAGDVTCTVASDIWSEDNSSVLIAKGSIVNGKYRTETSSGVETRIGIIWGRFKTTDDRVAMMDSPATGPQGEAGIAADSVEYHFWKKFSSAIAVSFIDGALRNVGSGDSNADVVVNSATNSGSDIVSEILRSTINIPPTRKAHQGAGLIIFLNKDISFERAY